MKKSNLFFAMAAGAMLVTSCASEQEMPNSPADNEAGKQLIVLSVANDNENTRAGRPLLSSEAAQAIDNVKVIVTDQDNNVVWVHTVENWMTGETPASTIYGDTQANPTGRGCHSPQRSPDQELYPQLLRH